MPERSNKVRRALLIAHYFPPGTSSGTLRTVKFARYLPQWNWEPVILTMDPRAYLASRQDPSLLKELHPDLKICRTGIWDIDRVLANWRRSVRGLFKRNSNSAPATVSGAIDKTRDTGGPRNWSHDLRDWLHFPDHYGNWFPPAVLRGLRILRREKIQVLYSTAPSPVSHMIALALKRISGLPWAADYRDPWECLFPESIYMEGQNPSKIRAEVAMAERCVRGADLNIINTTTACELFRQRFPDIDPKRFVTLPNGFDPLDFAGIRGSAAAGKRLTFLHAGTFFPKLRTPDEFLAAMAQLIESHRIDPARVLVRFAGCGPYPSTPPYVEVLPRVPHKESLAIMAESDVLLLLQQSAKYRMMVPAKTYEYMAVGKWILTIAPEGATRELAKSLPNAVVVEPGDGDGLKTAILSFYQRFLDGSLYPVSTDEQIIRRFTRQDQTRVLASFFDELTGGPLLN